MKLFSWFGNSKTIDLPKYVVAFDILNIISCFAVVALHVNGVFWTFSYDRYWITSNFIESLFYYAVPVFIMISGATLINYRDRYSTGEFFKKRVIKTFVPFIIWSIIAIAYNFIKEGMSIFGSAFSFKTLYEMIFFTKANNHYWFFIVLFALYLSMPLLSAVEKQKRKTVFSYTAFTAILTYSVLPLVFKLLGLSFNTAIQLPVAAGYVLYLLVGYLVTHYQLSKAMRTVIYVFGLVGFAFHFLGTHFLSYKAGTVDVTFKNYLNIPCVVFSVAVFVFVFYNKHLPKNPKVIKFVRTLSGASFGVYLCHRFVIDIILLIFGFNVVSIWWRSLGTVAVYILCVAIVIVIKKIPILKHTVP